MNAFSPYQRLRFSRGASRFARGADGCKRLLGSHHVLALHKAARVLTRRHVREQDIVLQRAKEWNPRSDQHRDARDDEPLNEPRLKKPLNRYSAIDVDMFEATSGEQQHDLAWSARQVLNDCTRRRGGERATAEDEHGLLGVGPRIKGQDRFECISADDQRVHCGHEFIVAVRLATAWGKKVEIAVASRNEAIKTRPDKDRCLHWSVLVVACLTSGFSRGGSR